MSGQEESAAAQEESFDSPVFEIMEGGIEVSVRIPKPLLTSSVKKALTGPGINATYLGKLKAYVFSRKRINKVEEVLGLDLEASGIQNPEAYTQISASAFVRNDSINGGSNIADFLMDNGFVFSTQRNAWEGSIKALQTLGDLAF